MSPDKAIDREIPRQQGDSLLGILERYDIGPLFAEVLNESPRLAVGA